MGYVLVAGSIPDYIEIGRIYYKDLYKFSSCLKWHNHGIWIVPQDTYLSIQTNLVVSTGNQLIPFFTILT